VRCNDCGEDILQQEQASPRQNLCCRCFENRAWILRHAPEIGWQTYHAIQNAMVSGKGKVKGKIEKLKKKYDKK
jgi:hypothetical protein